MASGLIELKAQIRAAAAAKDAGKVKELLGEFRQKAASFERSQRNARQEYSATAGDTLFGSETLSKLHQGMASGLVNVGRRAGQLLTPKSMEAGLGVSDQDIENQEGTDRELASTLPGGTGRFLTEAAVTAPVAGGAGTVARGLLGAVRAGRLLTGAGGLAAEGAAGGELTSGDPGTGALWGLGLGGGLKLAGKLAKGARTTAEAKRLMRADVDMTPGQMNPKGVLAQLEQGVEHVPWLGPMMRGQRARLAESGERAIVSEQTGRRFAEDTPFPAMVRDTNRHITEAYNRVRGAAGPMSPTGGNQITAEWNRAISDPAIMAGDQTRETVRRFLDNKLSALWRGRRTVSGEDLMQMRSDLRDQVRTLRRQAQSGGGEQGLQADLLERAEDALTTQINHTLPPHAQQLLAAADRSWARYKPLEEVAHAAASRAQGTPTIGQIVNGLKKSAGQSRWSGRGAGRGQQLVEDVRDAAEKTVRPTGASLLSQVAGGVASIPLLMGATRRGARIYAGRTGAQRGARRLAVAARQTPGVRHLIQVLRRGAAGALTDNPEE